MSERFQELRTLANEYLSARKKFIDAVKQLEVNENSTELKGNDNIVGRIGEFIAIQYLSDQNRNPQKVIHATNKGFDLKCDNGVAVSVKTITYENRTGQTTKLHPLWDEFILVLINEDLKVDKIGHITKPNFEKAIKDKIIAEMPYVRRQMLKPNGLFDKYGIIESNATSKYL